MNSSLWSINTAGGSRLSRPNVMEVRVSQPSQSSVAFAKAPPVKQLAVLDAHVLTTKYTPRTSNWILEARFCLNTSQL